MTALCSTGSSMPLPSAPAFFTFDEADIAVFLRPVAGLVTLSLMGIPSAPVETATFCSTEPNQDLPTNADYLALISPPLALASGAYQRFGNQIKYDKWIQLCGCGPTGTGTCTLTNTEYTNATQSVNTNGVYGLIGTWPIRAGSNNIRFTLTNNGDRNLAYRFPLQPVGPSNNLNSGTNLAAGATVVRNYTTTDLGPLSIWDAFSLELAGNVGFVGTVSVLVEQSFLGGCGNPVPVIPPPLAPPTGWPDPPAPFACGSYADICLAIQNLADRVRGISVTVDLIQRQHVPFAYVPGAAFAGLEDTGVLNVQGLLAISVELTAAPSYLGYLDGSPVRLFDAGRVAFGTADGYQNPLLIMSSASFFTVGPEITLIGYTFPPGVVATIQTFTREP